MLKYIDGEQANPNEGAKMFTGSRITLEGNVYGFSELFHPQRVYAADDIFLVGLPNDNTVKKIVKN
jgi:hypothetical protein